MIFWGFLLLFILIIAIVVAIISLKRGREAWEMEMLYLTRHEQKTSANLDSLRQAQSQPTLWARARGYIAEKQQQKQQREAEKQQQNTSEKPTPTVSNADENPAEDLADLPIFASVQVAKTDESAKIKTEITDENAWNLPYFEHENSPSVLSQPEAELPIITLPENHSRKKEEPDLPIIEKLDLPSRSTITAPSEQQAKKIEKKQIEENLPIIELEDIRANLLRQRRARRQDATATPEQKTDYHRPQTIQQDEILANLLNTDSPINRQQHKNKREAVRESIIPESARMSDVVRHSEKQPISTRFTPYTQSPTVENRHLPVYRTPENATLPEKTPSLPSQDADVGDWRSEFKSLRDELFADSTDNTSEDSPFDNLPSFDLDTPNQSWSLPTHQQIGAVPENPFAQETLAEKKSTQIDAPLIEEEGDDVPQAFRQPQRNNPVAPAPTNPFRQPENPIKHPESKPLSSFESTLFHRYPLPDLSLLLPAKNNPNAALSEEEMLQTGILIEEKLQEFRVKVNVVDAYAGPVITRYEIEPDVGVRGNQVINLEKDLARALGCASIRIVETIPGKTCMGLELPNPQRQVIRLSEMVGADIFRQSPSRLTVALGHDISGKPVVTDLAKAPHLLVAGTTGSGKSVGVNAMILSILFKATPEEVRLIMIDPKMLELSIYEGIPHLLAPVVTDMKLAANALIWCVNEMEKRYRLMSHVGVRNLAGFNRVIQEAQQRGERIGNPFSLDASNPEPLEKLPFIVVIVDEFADLMMSAGKKIEELIARLAQKARAAGIHLILATQRPSVDVITGLIKANIPTRIAFQVSSKIDSRTILDQMGAENLLGQGDMLFLPPGSGYPQRVHGAFVADEEVHHVVEYLKQFGEPNYVEDILTSGVGADDLFSNSNSQRNHDIEQDPMYDNAVSFVLQSRKASISAIQRHLRIGYNRAASIVEHMEKTGLLSAPEGNGTRTVLVPEQ